MLSVKSTDIYVSLVVIGVGDVVCGSSVCLEVRCVGVWVVVVKNVYMSSSVLEIVENFTVFSVIEMEVVSVG